MCNIKSWLTQTAAVTGNYQATCWQPNISQKIADFLLIISHIYSVFTKSFKKIFSNPLGCKIILKYVFFVTFLLQRILILWFYTVDELFLGQFRSFPLFIYQFPRSPVKDRNQGLPLGYRLPGQGVWTAINKGFARTIPDLCFFFLQEV